MFTVLVNFIVLNILISILNDSIAETENELDSCEQEKKDEFLEYVKEIFTGIQIFFFFTKSLQMRYL